MSEKTHNQAVRLKLLKKAPEKMVVFFVVFLTRPIAGEGG
jgi:hypothetical protein